MATVGNTVRTLLDAAKSFGPDGQIAKVAELLSINNEIMGDVPMVEGNLITGNQSTVRVGLPAVAWRLLNGGIVPSKSIKAQLTEQCGLLEAWSEIDIEVANLGGNPGAARLSESIAFIEAMGQEFTSVLFYGTATTPEKFVGLSTRYGSLTAGNSQNIIDAGGTGTDNTSIWLVVWGEDTITGIYPKGSTAGLNHKDLGEQTVTVTTGVGGSRMRAYQDQYIWKCGIALKDWRYVVRICNIDVSNLVAESGAADLTDRMIRSLTRVPQISRGRAAFYMNRTAHEFLTIQRRQDVRTGGQLTFDVVDGVVRWSFMGIPIRRVDSLLLTEARVT